MVKIKISSTSMCKKISKWLNSLKTSMVKKSLGFEGLSNCMKKKDLLIVDKCYNLAFYQRIPKTFYTIELIVKYVQFETKSWSLRKTQA